MVTKNLKLNQLSEYAYKRYYNYLLSIDNKDIDSFSLFLDNTVSVQFNNDVPMRGKTPVLNALSYYWQTFGKLEHDLINIMGKDNSHVLEALNHYTKNDGSIVSIHAVAFTDWNEDGKITSIRIYQDVSPVFK